jgi:nicotinamide-nucleotide amidase
MATGVARLLHAEVAIATSGVAGAIPQDGSPSGAVYVATLVDGDVRTTTHHLHGSRATVADGAARAALHQVLDHLRDHVAPRPARHGVECGGSVA